MLSIKEQNMPYVRIEMLEGRTLEQKAAIARAITQALETHGGVQPQSISVVFENVKRDDWAVGGVLVSQRDAAVR